MPSRATSLLTGLGAILGAIVALTMLLGCSASSDAPQAVGTDGPVGFTVDPRFVQSAGVHADAGESVVFGATTVHNTGTAAATLTDGSLTGRADHDGASVAEVRVLDSTSPSTDLVGAATWPFEDYKSRSRPLRGYRLAPGREVELLFVVNVDQTGAWYWPQTTLRYQNGTRSYATTANFGFVICPRASEGCAPPV